MNEKFQSLLGTSYFKDVDLLFRPFIKEQFGPIFALVGSPPRLKIFTIKTD
jgi:hypothetical protein